MAIRGPALRRIGGHQGALLGKQLRQAVDSQPPLPKQDTVPDPGDLEHPSCPSLVACSLSLEAVDQAFSTLGTLALTHVLHPR